AKTDLEKKLADMSRAKEKSDQDMAALKSQAASLNSGLDEKIKASQRSLKEETDGLNKKLKDSEAALRTKDDEIKKIKGQDADLNQQIARLTDDQTKFKALLDAAKKDNIKLQADIAAARK